MKLASLILVLLLVAGAVAQTSKTAPKTTQKKSAAASAAAKPPVAKKTTAAKKTPTTAKKKTTRSKKRVVARKRVQAQPTPERYTEIQNALISRGHSPGPASGTWSTDWADALRRFQQDQKLEATGKIDALSLMRLGLGPKREIGAQPGSLEASEPRSPAQ